MHACSIFAVLFMAMVRMVCAGAAPPANRGTTVDPPVPPRPSGAAMSPLARYLYNYPFVHHIIITVLVSHFTIVRHAVIAFLKHSYRIITDGCELGFLCLGLPSVIH